jgi:hypothetical protein
MNNVLEFINSQSWFGIVSAVIALASAISAVTPTPKPDTFLAKVYSVIDFLALNIGKAKDKGDEVK